MKGDLVAAIAPWFRLHLPSCGPGFDSQTVHLRFFSICIIEIVSRKRGRDLPIFKNERGIEQSRRPKLGSKMFTVY